MSTPKHIIIGAGIAGLYAAYNLKKQNIPFIILEKSSAKDIGGRMGSPLFHGTHVAKGAGVGRKRKDRLLIQLLDELKVPYKEFKSSHQYADTIDPPCNVKETFLFIKQKYEASSHKPNTFKSFAEPLLGKEAYQNFITCAGYTDYESEDIESTLYDYGFDDNYTNWTGLSIPWDILLHKIIEKIGAHNIHTNTTVTHIEHLVENPRYIQHYPPGAQDNYMIFSSIIPVTENGKVPYYPKGGRGLEGEPGVPPGYIIHTEKGKSYETNHIIIATTITPLRKLLPNVPEYKQICSQPFLRIYGKFSKASIHFMMEKARTLTVVPGPLHKIIPMNPEDGIYMIVYTDNKGATSLKGHKENTPENRSYLCRKLEKALGLPKEALHLLSIIDFYWEDGTHYYKPLDKTVYNTREEFLCKAKNPYPNIYVVGEMVSQNQGWVEGALESVRGV